MFTLLAFFFLKKKAQNKQQQKHKLLSFNAMLFYVLFLFLEVAALYFDTFPLHHLYPLCILLSGS